MGFSTHGFQRASGAGSVTGSRRRRKRLGELMVLEAGATVALTSNTDRQVVLLGGAPLDAPRYLWWNHVAGSEALLEEARQAWREQRYAMVAGDPEFIPLPDDGRATLRIEAD